MKKILLLTSGGDAPGMNAAIRAVVRVAIYNDLEVYSATRGYHGLLNNKVKKMSLRSVGDIIHRGGTTLQTARCDEFKTDEGMKKAIKTLKEYEIDGLVVIGGDGSFRGAQALSKHGINTVGIPATIDNDLQYTDYTLGFDTALNTVTSAIGNLRDTSSSHNRANIIEVMGRNCGDIALYSGLAGGADGIIVPETPYNMDALCDKILAGKKRGKRHHIIVVAEGALSAYDIANYIKLKISVSTRVTVIGHLQRGGTPTAFDRNLAAKYGFRAVNALLEGKTSRVVGIKSNQVFDIDIDEALNMKKTIDNTLFEMAEILSI